MDAQPAKQVLECRSQHNKCFALLYCLPPPPPPKPRPAYALRDNAHQQTPAGDGPHAASPEQKSDLLRWCIPRIASHHQQHTHVCCEENNTPAPTGKVQPRNHVRSKSNQPHQTDHRRQAPWPCNHGDGTTSRPREKKSFVDRTEKSKGRNLYRQIQT